MTAFAAPQDLAPSLEQRLIALLAEVPERRKLCSQERTARLTAC